MHELLKNASNAQRIREALGPMFAGGGLDPASTAGSVWLQILAWEKTQRTIGARSTLEAARDVLGYVAILVGGEVAEVGPGAFGFDPSSHTRHGLWIYQTDPDAGSLFYDPEREAWYTGTARAWARAR